MQTVAIGSKIIIVFIQVVQATLISVHENSLTNLKSIYRSRLKQLQSTRFNSFTMKLCWNQNVWNCLRKLILKEHNFDRNRSLQQFASQEIWKWQQRMNDVINELGIFLFEKSIQVKKWWVSSAESCFVAEAVICSFHQIHQNVAPAWEKNMFFQPTITLELCITAVP